MIEPASRLNPHSFTELKINENNHKHLLDNHQDTRIFYKPNIEAKCVSFIYMMDMNKTFGLHNTEHNKITTV